MTSSSLSPARRGFLIDAALVAVVLVSGGLLLQPGVFSVDESHYLLAASAMAERGSFQIENGFEALHAPQLLFFYTVVPDRVVELGTVWTVPPFHALLAAPFVWLGGLRGLFWLNLISFALAAVAVRRMGVRLRPGPAFGLAAAGLYLLGALGLEYALGIWPHALSQGLCAWALLLCLRAAQPDRKAPWCAWAAGLLLGIATGVRLQNLIWLPVLLVAAWRWLALPRGRLLAFAGGWLLPLLGFAWINLVRLGTLNPFTYGAHKTYESLATAGSSPAGPWALILLAAAALGGGLLLAGPGWRRRLPWALGAAVLLLASLCPQAREVSTRWLGMAAFHVVDSAFYPGSGVIPGAGRNELGQVLYGGVLKRALLEVAPFLVLALLGVAARARLVSSPQIAFLSGAGLLAVLALPFIASSGGFCFNPRYLLEPIVPLALAALWWAFELHPPRASLLGGALLGLLLALPVLLAPGKVGDPAGGWLPALLPLGLAALLLLAARLTLIKSGRARRLLLPLSGVLLAAALTFGAITQLGVDLARSLTVRQVAARMNELAREVIPDRSLLLAWEARKDVFAPLKMEREVWIGGLGGDDRNVPELLRAALAAGRAVLILQNDIPAARWEAWSAGLAAVRISDRQGLRFVELALPGGGP